MRPFLLAWVVASTSLTAQDPEGVEWNTLLRQRIGAGEDLIELRYRRDDHGLLEVASCELGALPFQPMFPDVLLPRPRLDPRTILAALLLSVHGRHGVLGCTDAERHLRRAGIDQGPMSLRQFLLTPIGTKDPVRARVEAQDRIVAIDWLVRGGHQGVVAELTALTKQADTPPLLAEHATAALEMLGRRPATPRRRFDAESLRLPVVADVHVVIDHARLPDTAPLAAIARRWAIDQSYRVVEALRAPTPDDLFHGQYIADLLGELPFEVARRYGCARFDQTVLSLQIPPPGTGTGFGWHLQSVGRLEHGRLADTLEHFASAPQSDMKCERRGDSVHFAVPGAQGEFDATSVVAHTKGMGGRPRPESARELLEEGPALRAVVPPTSKVWLALAWLQLPPAGRSELTLSFGEEARLCLSITARDEDAAAAWAERGRQLLAKGLEGLRAAIVAQDSDARLLRPVLDAIAATSIRTDGARVEAVLTCRELGTAVLLELCALLR
jgi:hypothetical protein